MEKCEKVWDDGLVSAYPGIRTRAGLLNFNNHPMTRIPVIKANKIPIIMLYGTEDRLVNYNANGKLLEAEYSDMPQLLTVIQRYLNGHHPHGFVVDTEGKTDKKLDEICRLIIEKSRDMI